MPLSLITTISRFRRFADAQNAFYAFCFAGIERLSILGSESKTADTQPTGARFSGGDLPLDVLQLLCEWHSVPFSREHALHGLPTDEDVLSFDNFVRGAAKLGLETKVVKRRPSKVQPIVYPIVVFLLDGRVGLAHKHDGDLRTVEVRFPREKKETFGLKELDRKSSPVVIYAARIDNYVSEASQNAAERAKEHWFWSKVGKFWPTSVYMGIAALVINLLGLALPIFVMNVYDRVIPYASFSTLWALVIGVSLALFLEFLLKVTRSSLISNASKRMDMAVSSNLFEQAMDAKLSGRTFQLG